MLEREIKHMAGCFRRCRCGKEPRHVQSTGRSSREPVITIAQARTQRDSTRHRLECPCGAVTARHATLDAAETQWGSDYAQLALPSTRPARKRRAS